MVGLVIRGLQRSMQVQLLVTVVEMDRFKSGLLHFKVVIAVGVLRPDWGCWELVILSLYGVVRMAKSI